MLVWSVEIQFCRKRQKVQTIRKKISGNTKKRRPRILRIIVPKVKHVKIKTRN